MAKGAFHEKKQILLSKKINITLRRKILKVYVWPITLYSAETCTYNTNEEESIKAFEMWCYARRMQNIKWVGRVTDDQVLQVNEQRTRIHLTRARKLQLLGHTLRHDSLM
ncbi:Hypothetical protein CINCED_3A015487 [Cinara cedri]|uniref:Uncharacterized protein n=1 Tax=Cinara cedri TaxID=506608 RepID=A0A5E4M4X8_9HEMI|nr:Hypothetical protein CINCED_3A015487 [Cinara cedri]